VVVGTSVSWERRSFFSPRRAARAANCTHDPPYEQFLVGIIYHQEGGWLVLTRQVSPPQVSRFPSLFSAGPGSCCCHQQLISRNFVSNKK
jgi:hypothetical protein